MFRSQALPGANVSQWAELLARYGWDVREALAVLDCESRGDPWALNPSSGACGLFQHLPCEGQGDPETSVARAWAKYEARGWQPWIQCWPG